MRFLSIFIDIKISTDNKQQIIRINPWKPWASLNKNHSLNFEFRKHRVEHHSLIVCICSAFFTQTYIHISNTDSQHTYVHSALHLKLILWWAHCRQTYIHINTHSHAKSVFECDGFELAVYVQHTLGKCRKDAIKLPYAESNGARPGQHNETNTRTQCSHKKQLHYASW